MANTVRLKRSAVQGKAPVVGDLSLGELAVNTYDGKLYMKKNDGSDAIVEIGAGGTTVSATAPSSPSTGDLWYDTEDARTFVWTGTEWVDAAPDAGYAVATTSDSAPANANDGDLWYRTSDGRMYVYYDDGSTAQWVDANPNLPVGSDTFNRSGTTVSLANSGDTVSLDGDLTVDTNTLHVDSAGNSVGIGTTTGRAGLTVALGSASIPAAGASTASAVFGNATDDATYGVVVGANTSGIGYIQSQRTDGTALTYDLAIQPNGGNVGIGTSSPEDSLHIKSNSGAIRLENTVVSNNDSTIAYDNTDLAFHVDPNNVRGSSNITFSGDGNERMRLDSSGRLMLANTDASSMNSSMDNFVLGSGSGSEGMTIYSGNTSSGFIGFNDAASATTPGVIAYDHNTDRMTFRTADTERIRINNDGVIAVNTTAGWFSRQFVVETTGSSVGGSAAFLSGDSTVYPVSVMSVDTSGDNNFVGFWTESRSTPTQRGDIDYNRAAGQVRYNVTSDRRLKSDIEPAESATDVLSSIQVRSYTWTESQHKIDYGFIAQELHEVVPDAVKQGDDGDEIVTSWAVDNSKLVPVLTKALQEALAKIETLEARIEALEQA